METEQLNSLHRKLPSNLPSLSVSGKSIRLSTVCNGIGRRVYRYISLSPMNALGNWADVVGCVTDTHSATN